MSRLNYTSLEKGSEREVDSVCCLGMATQKTGPGKLASSLSQLHSIGLAVPQHVSKGRSKTKERERRIIIFLQHTHSPTWVSGRASDWKGPTNRFTRTTGITIWFEIAGLCHWPYLYLCCTVLRFFHSVTNRSVAWFTFGLKKVVIGKRLQFF